MKMTDDGEQVTIFRALNRAATDNSHKTSNPRKFKEVEKQQIARGTGLRPQRVGHLMSDENPKSPTLTEAVCLAGEMHLSLEELVDRGGPLFPFDRNGIAWRLSGSPSGTEARVRRIAAARFLEGQDLETISEAVEVVYAVRGVQPPPLDEASVRDMVQGGLDMGLARFEVPVGARQDALENPELARELSTALAKDPKAPSLGELERRPRVRVVKNVADKSFTVDPVAPQLIARVAHEIVAQHMSKYRHVFSIGLAGGTHCSTFVRSTGAESSPFPDDSGDKKFTFVPLTLEPFSSHALPMADAVVGQMVSRTRSLLGLHRVDGLTLQSFGYVQDERVERLDDHGITRVRDQYRELDVAIFGCGDLERDGWLERVMRRVNIESDIVPATDVCLNLLDELGRPIALPKHREFVGISLRDICRLVRSPERLAVLVTSGQTKGRPIVVASRAGCTDTIVCDEAAAAAALEVLDRG